MSTPPTAPPPRHPTTRDWHYAPLVQDRPTQPKHYEDLQATQRGMDAVYRDLARCMGGWH